MNSQKKIENVIKPLFEGKEPKSVMFKTRCSENNKVYITGKNYLNDLHYVVTPQNFYNIQFLITNRNGTFHPDSFCYTVDYNRKENLVIGYLPKQKQKLYLERTKQIIRAINAITGKTPNVKIFDINHNLYQLKW